MKMGKIMTVTIQINDLCPDDEWLISHLSDKIRLLRGLYADVEKITIKEGIDEWYFLQPPAELAKNTKSL